jgi:CubicO group peptidase (beta-lactamase class C family)
VRRVAVVLSLALALLSCDDQPLKPAGLKPVDLEIERFEVGLLSPFLVPGAKRLGKPIAGRLQAWGVGALSVAVIEGGELRFARHYGQGQADAIFAVGDLARPLVATALLRLADQKQLDLDAALDLELSDGCLPSPRSARELLSAPLTRFSGAVIEQASGLPATEYLQKEVFAPVGMNHTSLGAPGPAFLPLLIGGNPVESGECRLDSLYASAADLARWQVDLTKAQVGRPSRRLRRDSARMMLDQGLGVQLAGEGQARHFKVGERGKSSTGLIIGFVHSGQGAVILVDKPDAIELVSEVVAGLAALYDWPAFQPISSPQDASDRDALARWAGFAAEESIQ